MAKQRQVKVPYIRPRNALNTQKHNDEEHKINDKWNKIK